MLYLCCIFAPSMSFFKQSIDFYSDISEWIEADTPQEAVQEYKREYSGILGSGAVGYTKVLEEEPIGSKGIKDGDCGKERATEIIKQYYKKNVG